MNVKENFSDGIRDAVLQVVSDVVSEQRSAMREMAIAHLQPAEALLGFEMGEKRLPFLVRIIPFVPRFLTAPKIFILAVTNQRVLILRVLKTAITGRTSGSQLTATIPLQQVQSVVPKVGYLTSSLVIRTTSGQAFRYTDMLKSAPTRFLSLYEKAKSG